MEKSLYESILQIQMKSTDELLRVIENFNPLIQKYKRKLNYEEAETDLIIALIETLSSINLENFEAYNDGRIVTFICNSMCNKSIDLFRKFILKKKEEIELNIDIIGSEIEDNIDNKILITELLENLSKRQKFIIIQRYFKCRSVAEIAIYLNISRQAVNKSKNEALKTLRKYIVNYVIA